MRDTRRCAKCRHGEILRLRRVAGEMVYMSRTVAAGSGTPAPGAALPSTGGTPPTEMTWRRAAPREAFICRACGYTEYYTLDLDSIPVDGDLVSLWGTDRVGPYR